MGIGRNIRRLGKNVEKKYRGEINMKKDNKLLLGIIATLYLYIKISKTRGYSNPGGEILLVPCIYIVKYLYFGFKGLFLKEEEQICKNK